MNHMYIRHTLGGRLFLDSIKHHTPYSIERKNDCWIFMINLADKSMARDLIYYRNELNIFVIGDASTQKSWFYTKEGLVEYDEANQVLKITTDVRMDYTG